MSNPKENNNNDLVQMIIDLPYEIVEELIMICVYPKALLPPLSNDKQLETFLRKIVLFHKDKIVWTRYMKTKSPFIPQGRIVSIKTYILNSEEHFIFSKNKLPIDDAITQ